jgi:HSP20 family protein
MDTLEKKPARRSFGLTPWSRPLDRFFRNDFLDFWEGDRFVETIPSINITEGKKEFSIDVAAPGLKKEDFNIDVEGNLLTISSKKETETESNGKETGGYTRKEYSYSSFSRTVSLPEQADNNGITAKYSDGILNITIPKKADAQKTNSQKIKIQ